MPRMVTIEIAINLTRGAQHFALHPAGITLGDFTFWIISVLILEYKIIINLADEFRSYPVVRIDIRIIRKLN